MLSYGHSVFLNGLTISMRTTHRERHDDLDGPPDWGHARNQADRGMLSGAILYRLQVGQPLIVENVGAYLGLVI